MLKKKVVSLLAIYALILPTLALAAPLATTVKKVKIKGYITRMYSPMSFEIDDMKVKRDETVKFDFDNQSPEVNFKPEDLRVGTEVQIEGILNEETGELQATKITIDLEQFRKLTNTTVLMEDAKGFEKTDAGWIGTLTADGRRIRIEPSTQVLFQLNKSEKKEAESAAKDAEKAAKNNKDNKDDKKADDNDDDDFAGAEPLKSINDVKAGMYATYEGIEQTDGAVLANRIVFVKNEMEKGEAKFWASMKLTEKAANLAEDKPAELKIDQIGKFKLLANDEVQAYVKRLGESLIPEYQKNLAPEDPQKINFRFYVIKDKDPNAFATANGIMVVNSGMIEILENEAQLASVISHEISHATQEHSWRQLNKDKGKRTALMVGAIAASLLGAGGVASLLQYTYLAMVNGYQRRLENQSDRMGLETLVKAGYDPREAPRVWKIMSKKNGDMPFTVFWASHSNNATRRSYLNIEIRNNYSLLDLDKMKKGDQAQWDRIVSLTKEAAAKKKK